MAEILNDETVVYKNEITDENYGILGFEKVLGKIQVKDEEGETITVTPYTDLQTIADTLFMVANNVNCPIFYGSEKPSYGYGKDKIEIKKGFWLDTSETE